MCTGLRHLYLYTATTSLDGLGSWNLPAFVWTFVSAAVFSVWILILALWIIFWSALRGSISLGERIPELWRDFEMFPK